MTDTPWLSIAIVWVVTLLAGGLLWQRFTRVPVQSGGFSRVPAPARRVLPLWLALLLLLLLIVAVWLTVRMATNR
jgi:hypothetical protein